MTTRHGGHDGRKENKMSVYKNMRHDMINYLQSMMDDFNINRAAYGDDDRIVLKKLDAMIACKEMVEAIIGEPVNLQMDGKVTIGF